MNVKHRILKYTSVILYMKFICVFFQKYHYIFIIHTHEDMRFSSESPASLRVSRISSFFISRISDRFRFCPTSDSTDTSDEVAPGPVKGTPGSRGTLNPETQFSFLVRWIGDFCVFFGDAKKSVGWWAFLWFYSTLPWPLDEQSSRFGMIRCGPFILRFQA